ncbi:MAG TPA: hypothetical protein VKX31_04085 [Brumimicrobium sp.]|nr:hypothetical protein [Brumimicrobium sp.]
MRNFIVKLVITAFLFIFFYPVSKVKAAPGDTTWVTIFDNLEINAWGNYEMQASLPPATESFQKVRLHYILGVRKCPGEQYCASWDYTTSVFAKLDSETSIELMRVITPYATDWPLSRTHTYVSEVTDYSSILNGDVDFVYNYDGYSWGFTLTLKLEFIEGVAPRQALSVENERIQLELDRNKKELHKIFNNLAQKNELIETLNQELLIKESQEKTKELEVEKMNLHEKIQSFTLLTEEDLIEFKRTFNKLYPDFYNKLKSMNSGLTNAEMRLAMLIKSNLSNLEMSRILGISQDSVRKTNLRLRKKLAIKTTNELSRFILSV